jgi:hypothetical protein
VKYQPGRWTVLIAFSPPSSGNGSIFVVRRRSVRQLSEASRTVAVYSPDGRWIAFGGATRSSDVWLMRPTAPHTPRGHRRESPASLVADVNAAHARKGSTALAGRLESTPLGVRATIADWAA